MSSLELKGLAYNELVNIEQANKNIADLNQLIKQKMETENKPQEDVAIPVESGETKTDIVKETGTTNTPVEPSPTVPEVVVPEDNTI